MNRAAFWNFERNRRKIYGAKSCLHPRAGPECIGPIVRAHSVQRASLSQIARNGHVYRMSGDLATLHRTDGVPEPALIGLDNASTFTGLCAHHDDDTFAPLEKAPFSGNAEQCGLLAYRALLREVHVKRASLAVHPVLKSYLDAQPGTAGDPRVDLIDAHYEGAGWGLAALQSHLQLLEDMVAHRDYACLRTAVIDFSRTPDVMASGVRYPVSDFDGNYLENYSRLASGHDLPDLLTCSLIGTASGGSAIFAWHAESDGSGDATLASLLRCERRNLSNALVRYAFETCENIFLAPAWWDELDGKARDTLLERFTNSVSPFTEFSRTHC